MKRSSKVSSYVWNYFEKRETGAVCCKCKKTIKLCGNTTNLSQHLKRIHDIHAGASSSDTEIGERNNNQQRKISEPIQ